MDCGDEDCLCVECVEGVYYWIDLCVGYYDVDGDLFWIV